MLTWALGSGSEQATERESVNKVNWRRGGRGDGGVKFGIWDNRTAQHGRRGATAAVAWPGGSCSSDIYTTSNDDCCCDFNYGELANNSSQLKLHCGI